jgi:hypothetical protein
MRKHSKKTIKVELLINWANKILSNTESVGDWDTVYYREGIIAMVEKILHESSCYKGYIFTAPASESISLGNWGNVCRHYLI